MWVLKGQEAIVPTSRNGRQKMIVYGMISKTISYLHVEEVLEETSETTASLFITLRATFPHRRLDVVLDNARWHYGADVKYVAKEYHIHLHYLPAYSPDLNPIEPLWQWIREEATYNYEYDSFASKKDAILQTVDAIRSQPDKMKKRLVRKFKN